MARVKNSVTARHRHNKLLELTKGHRASRHATYRQARESVLHALQYAYIHRRKRKGDMRRLWISRVNAASRAQGLSYGQFMHGLKEAGVDINRKMLADMAVSSPESFAGLVTTAKGNG